MIRLGIGQMHPKIGDTKHNRMQLEQILAKAEKNSVDVLVLPELINSGYAFSDKIEAEKLSEHVPEGGTSRLLEKWSRGRAVVAGICERTQKGLANSAPVFIDGELITIYRKIHLFNKEKEIFVAGDDEPPVVEFNGIKLGVMICWDWAFPEIARILALKGAQVILHPANLVLPYCQTVMIARAIENRVFAATANRVGKERDLIFRGESQIVSPKGERLVKLDRKSVTIAWVDIKPTEADDKMLTERNHLLKDRRPEIYRRLIEG